MHVSCAGLNCMAVTRAGLKSDEVLPDNQSMNVPTA